ncbi:Leucine-responsive regulatory protein [Sporomusa silvacetica DSM 10669]|uniref:Leucine-responsive regulatory protein n=1 Tax=Sporomusa silvacetica DSM 10669 TaxID=1123289 RepID=A0ABZ3IT01_9FIRM|nr:Lrp/AsnC family transcriptional regulator [Sporomusa silvacetica]OZC19445.1 leucine-responsive regulatory protein [Sporomusa silvacetica DSM 10669]
MDSVDIEIVKILEQNGRISHEEIAKILHMSRPAIHKRIENLEKRGIITGYQALIDWRKVRPCIRCLLFIKINGGYFAQIANEIATMDIPGIVIEECHRLVGNWCILIKTRISTPEDTTKILDRVWQFEGILETSTTFIIDTIL